MGQNASRDGRSEDAAHVLSLYLSLSLLSLSLFSLSLNLKLLRHLKRQQQQQEELEKKKKKQNQRKVGKRPFESPSRLLRASQRALARHSLSLSLSLSLFSSSSSSFLLFAIRPSDKIEWITNRFRLIGREKRRRRMKKTSKQKNRGNFKHFHLEILSKSDLVRERERREERRGETRDERREDGGEAFCSVLF